MREPINIAVAMMLGGLLVWGLPARQSTADDANDQMSEAHFGVFFEELFGGLTLHLYKNEEEYWALRRVQTAYDNAVRSLQLGDARAYKYHTHIIDREGGQTEHLRAARLAKNLRATLPAQFIPYFAYQRADGTVAADPDEFIRAQLKRAEELDAEGGGEGRD